MVLDFDYRGHALNAEADGQINSRDHDTSSPPDVNPGLVGWPIIIVMDEVSICSLMNYSPQLYLIGRPLTYFSGFLFFS